MGELLCQLCLDHRGPRPLPVVTAVEAVVQGDRLKPLVYHPFDYLPNRFKESNAAIIAASWDEDCDNPPILAGWVSCPPPRGPE